MRDEAIQIDPTLSAADQAVLYVLKRMRVDVDLRWYMLNTEAFARLCAAHAETTGKTPEMVEEFYSQLAPHAAKDVPHVVYFRGQMEKIRETIVEHREAQSGPAIMVLDEIESLTGEGK